MTGVRTSHGRFVDVAVAAGGAAEGFGGVARFSATGLAVAAETEALADSLGAAEALAALVTGAELSLKATVGSLLNGAVPLAVALLISVAWLTVPVTSLRGDASRRAK
ncbi:MAG: hypothetical protein JNK04_09455 [Myxococcales bacterium]|nr:hypothetical protein [Myxococcales bacterium]